MGRQKNLDAAKKAAGGKSSLKSNVKSLSILCPKVRSPPSLGPLPTAS